MQRQIENIKIQIETIKGEIEIYQGTLDNVKRLEALDVMEAYAEQLLNEVVYLRATQTSKEKIERIQASHKKGTN
jgi:conjugal transfer/entry exclusion protein